MGVRSRTESIFSHVLAPARLMSFVNHYSSEVKMPNHFLSHLMMAYAGERIDLNNLSAFSHIPALASLGKKKITA